MLATYVILCTILRYFIVISIFIQYQEFYHVGDSYYFVEVNYFFNFVLT